MTGPRWRKLVQLIELARFDLLFSIISNSWLVVFLAFSLEPAGSRNTSLIQLGLLKALTLATLTSGGLAGFGLALRDILNARHDRAFAPARPIPSGRVHIQHAAAVGILSLLVAMAAAIPLGKLSLATALLASGGILFYHFAGRFIPSIGIVCLGLVQVLTMSIPNPQLSFAWPILLTMTHSMACASLRYFLAGKRPRISCTDGWLLLIGWSFWTMVLIGLMSARGNWIGPAVKLIWAGPTLSAIIFVLLTFWLVSGNLAAARPRRVAANRFVRLSVVWLMVYDASWLVSAGLYMQSSAIVLLFTASILMSRLQTVIGRSHVAYSYGIHESGSDPFA